MLVEVSQGGPWSRGVHGASRARMLALSLMARCPMHTEISDATPYYHLEPERIIRALESTGLLCDGHLMPLNSYENRVYQVGIEGTEPLVAKFYRPGRWSNAQILEEHGFALELAEAEIPLVAPLVVDGGTLHEHEGFRFALFPRQGGYAPELDRQETRLRLGRLLGRIHGVGASRAFVARPGFDLLGIGREAIATLAQGQWLPPHLETAFFSLAEHLLSAIDELARQAGPVASIRIHGDCHLGNILWRDGPFFVDLDDCRMGPPMQDLWMMLSGDAQEMGVQLRDLLEGYHQFQGFNIRQLLLIEPLRTLRMLHHAAWLANRWQDPAFPRAFPWFGENRYWEDLVLGLREQLSRMQEPAIQLPLA